MNDLNDFRKTATESASTPCSLRNTALYGYQQNSLLIQHLVGLERVFQARRDSNKAGSSSSLSTGLNLDDPRFQSLATELESLLKDVAPEFSSTVIECMPDGNAWGAIMHGLPEGFSGWGKTLPEALRSLATTLELAQ